MKDPQLILELVGYAASLLVLVSLLMTSVVKLRVINMIGSFIFAIYALCIASYPTAIMNFCLVGVNIFYLVRIARTERCLTLLPTPLSSPYLQHFLQFYQQDLQTYFPRFQDWQDQADTAFFVCRDAEPVGLLLGRKLAGGALEVLVDYTTPQYRDCSIGQYLYQQLPGQGFLSLRCHAPAPAHQSYLKKMGFLQDQNDYVKTLSTE